MKPSEEAITSAERLLSQLLAERDRAPCSGQEALVERYMREFPEHKTAIRDLLATEAIVCSQPNGKGPAGRRLLPGQQIGPFRIVRFISQGGMGEVYEAIQDVLERRVALKVVRNGFVSATARSRFLREQQVLARLHQTNIVPIHFAGEQGDLQYCAMQFVDGVPLNRVLTELIRYESSGANNRITPPIRAVVASLSRAGSSTDDPSESGCKFGSQPGSARMPLMLSASYFRSVAMVLIQVADAIQHGHDHNICHRDIKPSNLIIDASETCWVIDYGLAGVVNALGLDSNLPDGIDTKLSLDPLGTPPYMAPEQFKGISDARSDIWSLGVTLYELIALTPAFPYEGWKATQQRILETGPADPRTFVRNIPADLIAIYRKAAARNPNERYSTARDFADDLRRWLNARTTRARPSWHTLRPLRLWAWRHKAWAMTAVATLALLITGLLSERGLAEQRRRQLVDLDQQKNREAKVVAAQNHWLSERNWGWSRAAMSLLIEANSIRPGDDLAQHAAATLFGPDARLIRRYHLTESNRDQIAGLSQVTFASNGSLLAGGWMQPRRNTVDLTPALFWDTNFSRGPTESKFHGAGPVAFADDDTPLHLAFPAGDRWNLLLQNVRTSEIITAIELPKTRSTEVHAVLSLDGRLAAASLSSIGPDEKPHGTTIVWALDPKKPGSPARKLSEWAQLAQALAFSPDGKYIAGGGRKGAVSVRDALTGKELVELPGDLPVHSLAFGRNVRTSVVDPAPRVNDELARWLLAVGTDGGTTAVWNVHQRQRLQLLQGNSHYVNSIAFDPNGSSLIAVGHLAPVLYDVNTGRPVLRFDSTADSFPRSLQTGVAISSDGRQVAITSSSSLGGRGGVDVIAIDEDRGIRTYRGLNSNIQYVWLSPTRRWVAALAQNWQIAVWERTTGRLTHIWQVHAGWTADNSDLIFEGSEETILFASGEQAIRLNLRTGEESGRWNFPPGLNDNLVARPGRPPLLFRREFGEPTLVGQPRSPGVFRARELLDNGRVRKTLDTSLGVTETIQSACLYSDGSYVLVTSRDGKRSRGDLFRLDDNGLTPVTLPEDVKRRTPGAISDNGRFMLVQANEDDANGTSIYRLPNFEHYGQQGAPILGAIDNSARLGIAQAAYNGITLYRIGEFRPLISFDVGSGLGSSLRKIQFGDGRFLFWGRADGTVCVADINRCLESLAPFSKD